MQEEREAGEQGQTGCSAGWGGTQQQPLPTPRLHQWKAGGASIHGRHTGPWGVGSTHHRARAMTHMQHTWADTELVGTAQARCRGNSRGTGDTERRPRAPGRERPPDGPPYTWACAHTGAHGLVCTLRHTCSCRHTDTWARTHAVPVPRGEGSSCRGHSTHLGRGGSPLSSGETEPRQHQQLPRSPVLLHWGWKVLPSPTLGMCCPVGGEQRMVTVRVEAELLTLGSHWSVRLESKRQRQ